MELAPDALNWRERTKVGKHIAERILEVEWTSNHHGGPARSAFTVCDKLRTSLSAFVGVAGYHSLLSRARTLALADVAWIKSIAVQPDGSLIGLEVTSGLTADEIARGETVLITQLIGLLVTFIGEPLTLRLLQDTWPEVSRSDINPGSEPHK